MSLATYQNSGKVNAFNFLLTPVILAGAALIGWVYTQILYFNPIILLSLLLFAGFCFLLATIAEKAVKVSHCRNKFFAAITGLMIGGGIVYVSHVTLYATLFKVNLWELALSPSTAWEMATIIAKEGYFSILSASISGFFLWTIWAIEAIGLIAIPVIFCMEYSDTSVYCEDCKRWADEDESILGFTADDHDSVDQRFNAGDFSFLQEVYPVETHEMAQPGQHFTIDEEWCKECCNLFTLSLRKHHRQLDNKGNLNTTTTTLAEDLVVPEELHNLVRETVDNGALQAEDGEMEFSDMISRMMALMVLADGEVDDAAVQVMTSICNQVTEDEVSEEKVREIVAEVQTRNITAPKYAQSLAAVLNPEGKALIVKAVLMVAYADNQVTEEEDARLLEMANGLGMTQEEFDAAVQAVSGG